MKKRISLVLLIVLVLAIVTTVFAISADDPFVQRVIERGYTQQDAKELSAVLVLSDENVIDYILQKYKALGDWKKVREAYGIDETEYQEHMKTQSEWQAILDRVPKGFMTSMKETMTREEINYFVNRMNIMDIDFEYAWKQYQSGKTTEEIIIEKKEAKDKQSEMDTKYILGKISTEEYVKAVADITNGDEITIGKILSDVQELRTEVRNRHRVESGITDEEIKYCEAQGMTNPMDMFQAKYISVGSNVSFDKVVESKLKYNDWITVVADVRNIPEAEYRKMREEAQTE